MILFWLLNDGLMSIKNKLYKDNNVIMEKKNASMYEIKLVVFKYSLVNMELSIYYYYLLSLVRHKF